MPDVQTLGVKVTLDGAQQAAQGLDNVAQAGARAEAATKRLIGTNDGLTASQRFLAQQNAQTIAAMEKALGTTGLVTAAVERDTAALVENVNLYTQSRAVVLAHAEALKINEGATAAHGLQLGRLNMELGTFIGRLTGTNTAVTRLSAMLGGSVIGYGAMIGSLVAISGLLWVWDKMKDGTDEAKKKQDELTASLIKWYETQAAGGQRMMEVAAATRTLADEQKHLLELYHDLERLNSNYNAKTGLLDTASINATNSAIAALMGKMAEGRKAIQAGTDDAHKSGDEAIVSLQRQIERQQELNAVYGLSELVIKRVGLQFDALADKEKFAQDKDHTADQIAAYDRLRDALLATQLRAADLAAGVLQTAYAAARFADIQPGLASALANTTAQIADENAQHRATNDLYSILLGKQKETIETGKESVRTAKELTKADAEAVKAQQQYAQDMQDIWTKGIEKIVTNGTKSFHDFFDDVLRMFEQLMKRMEKAGNDSGIGYQLLGLGSAAITGGVAGYQLGQSGGSGVGLLGGAASGALLGGQIAGPWGAVAGGLAGAVGGLLGAADAHKKAAAALQQAADSFTKQETAYTSAAYSNNNSAVAALSAIQNQYAALIDALNNLYGPSGPYGASPQDVAYRARRDALGQARDVQAQNLNTSFVAGLGQQYNATFGAAGAYANQVDAINQQYVQNSASARALGLGDGAQVEITAIRDRALQQLAEALEKANTQSQQNSLVRIATANGNTDLASWLSLQFQHQQALDDAIAQGLDDTSVALIKQANAAEDAAFQLSLVKAIQQKQLDAANALLGEYQKQTDAQSQAIQQTQQVVDTLQKFKDSIGLSGLSTLSPGQQVASARQQFQALVAQAMTGDATAASGLPGSAQTLLQASRSYNASGAGYVKDYKDVLAAVGAVQDQFGGTLSTEQLMLKELQRQTDQLNKQIALLQTGNQTAAAQYVQATLDAASRNGGIDTAIQQIHALFPGLQIGYSGGLVQSPGGAPGLMTPAGSIGANNNDFRDFDTYWSSTIKGYGGIQSFLDSGYPGAQSILARLHDDGIPGYWTGGAFGGGLMRVGEHGPEIIASGRASVMTPQQINAGIEKRLDTLIARFDQLTNVTRLNGAKATSKR